MNPKITIKTLIDQINKINETLQKEVKIEIQKYKKLLGEMNVAR